MNQRLVWILTVSVLAACGGARQAPAPIYDLRATPAPLEYAAEVSSLTVVETPGGEQEIASTTTIVMTIAYGAPTSEGLPIEVVFSEFSTEGPAPDLSAMLGLPFRGIVGEGGEIELTETPDLDVPGFDAASLLHHWQPGALDVITITSNETLQNLFDMAGSEGQPLLRRLPLVVASRRQALLAEQLGFSQAVRVADNASDEALLAALQRFRAARDA